MLKIVLIGGSLDAFVHFRIPLILDLLRNVNIHVVCIYFDNANSFAVPAIDSARCDWVNLGCSSKNKPWFDFDSIFKLHKVLQSIQPDKVISFNAKPLVYVGLIKSIFHHKFDAVALLEGLGTGFKFLKDFNFRGFLKSLLLRRSFRSYDSWIFLNHHDNDLFRDLRFIKSPCDVLLINGIGVDLGRYSNSKAAMEIWRNQSVGFAGRLIKEKGPDIFLETARLVRDRVPNVKFKIACFASEYGPETKAKWLKEEALSSMDYYEDMRLFYSNVSVVMLPTFYLEGLPAVLMEAQAMGLPVLVNGIPQIKNALENGKSGFIVNENDPAIFADHIIRLLTDYPYFRLFHQHAIIFSRDQFCVSRTNRKIVDFVFRT